MGWEGHEDISNAGRAATRGGRRGTNVSACIPREQKNGLRRCVRRPRPDSSSHCTERGTPMKVNRKSALALGALVTGAMLALAGCAGGASGGGGSSSAPALAGELTVWVDQNRADALKDIVKTFQDETDVKVTLVVKDNAKIRDDFTSQVPTGKGPDITI